MCVQSNVKLRHSCHRHTSALRYNIGLSSRCTANVRALGALWVMRAPIPIHIWRTLNLMLRDFRNALTHPQLTHCRFSVYSRGTSRSPSPSSSTLYRYIYIVDADRKVNTNFTDERLYGFLSISYFAQFYVVANFLYAEHRFPGLDMRHWVQIEAEDRNRVRQTHVGGTCFVCYCSGLRMSKFMYRCL